MNEPIVRIASAEDTEALLEIYAPYVRGTAITFEYEVPSAEEFRGRILGTLEKYPWLCLALGLEILGYAYAAPFRSRRAYQWTAETSIYLAPGAEKKGSGRLLYERLEEICRAMGLVSLYACITSPQEEDPYVTDNSVRFHEHMGYRMLARFPGCGRKFGRWYDTVYMEKPLCDRRESQAEPIWFPKLEL